MPSERKAALFLSPEAPYPLAGGGALRSASLLQWLSERYDVDLVVFREPGAPDPRAALPPNLVRDASVLDLRYHSGELSARAWRNFRRFLRGAPPLNDRFAGYGGQLERILAGHELYDLAVVEHFWCAGYAPVLRPRCRQLVLDLHNIESNLHVRCAATGSPVERVLMQRFGRALLELERKWLPQYDKVLVTSEDDARRASEISAGCQPVVYPNAIPYVTQPLRRTEPVVIFSGNLQYHPNREAVRFFRRRIWPAIRTRFPEVRWRLVGKNPDAVRQVVADDPRIELTGPVEDAIAEIARGQVAVAPLLAGSGTRVKILEAWAAGVPMVTTAVGAEGLLTRDGVDAVIRDSPEEFAAEVIRLLGSPALREKLGDAGRRRYENHYTWRAAWEKLDAGLSA